MMPNKNDYDDPDFNPFEEDETDGTLYPDASSLNEELGESSDDAHSGKGASRPAAGRADFRSSSLVPEDYLDSHDGSDDSKPNKGPFIGESSFDETVLGESDIDNPAEDFAESMGGNSYPDEGSLDGRPIVSKDSGTLNPAGIIGESSFDETVLSQSDIDEGTEAYSESMKQDVLSGDDFQDDIGTDGDRSGSGGKSNQKGGSGGAIGHVASDSSIHEETVRLYESMGGLGDDMDEFEEFVSAADDGSDSDASDQPGRSSQIWRSSSKTGSSEAPVRKISGEAPFGQSPGADYVVQEKLAEGGMGAVYIAKQVSLNRTLAIKTLKPLKDEDRRALEKSGRLTQRTRQLKEGFLSEAQVTANLVHPNIVPIHDLAQTEEGIPFYSMKLVNGAEWSSPKRNKSRKDLMDDPIRKMSLEENLDVLLKVCDGMAYAHSEGVVNRDLKPENVVVGDFGEVIILDWGLAVPAQD